MSDGIDVDLLQRTQGQLYRKKVPPANMKNVLDFSAKNPRDRLQIIEAGVNGSVIVLS